MFILKSVGKGTHDEQTQSGFYSILAFFLFLMIEKITGLIPNAHALGILNLVANFFDNSAHGTTVVGAFEVSLTVYNLINLQYLMFFNS